MVVLEQQELSLSRITEDGSFSVPGNETGEINDWGMYVTQSFGVHGLGSAIRIIDLSNLRKRLLVAEHSYQLY